MDTPAPLVIGTRGDVVVLSPAPVQLGAVHLLPGGTSIPRGDDGVELIHDDSAKVPPEAGTLVGTPGGKVEKVLMPVGPHERNIGKTRT